MHTQSRIIISARLLRNMPKRETLSDVLDRVEALIKCGAATFKELAKEFGKPESRFSEWVTMRAPTPNGEVAIRLREWADGKIEGIQGAGATAYRKALKEVRERRAAT